MIKAIFFDVDGTLFSHRSNRILDSTKLALRQLKEKGILTFVASGRHILEMREMPMEDLESLEFEGFITLNGQFCYNRKEVIRRRPIPRCDILALLKALEEKSVPCGFFEEDRKYINYNNETVEKIYERMASPLLEVGDLNRGKTEDVFQISVYDIKKEEEQWLRDRMPNCQFTRWSEHAVDVLSANGGKDRGIEAVLRYYSIDREESMAFGDAANDIAMLDYVGTAVVMENGKPEAKAHADYITDDADHDGIYRGLQKFGVL